MRVGLYVAYLPTAIFFFFIHENCGSQEIGTDPVVGCGQLATRAGHRFYFAIFSSHSSFSLVALASLFPGDDHGMVCLPKLRRQLDENHKSITNHMQACNTLG